MLSKNRTKRNILRSKASLTKKRHVTHKKGKEPLVSPNLALHNVQDERYWINRPIDDIHRDWGEASSNWIEGYCGSISHPHRQTVINLLNDFQPQSLLEIGCNCGPNLYLARQLLNISDNNLAGIDVNADVIKKAKDMLPAIDYRVGIAWDLPFEDKRFDIVLADAILMYVNPINIRQTLSEMKRVAKKGMIIVDRFDHSLFGIPKNYLWYRNYEKLLQDLGYMVKKIKISQEMWPTSQSWIKDGYIFVAQAQ